MPSFLLWDVDMRSTYNAVRCPTLVIRGADSPMLLRSNVEEMKVTGPKASVVEFAETAHAPALMANDQIEAIRSFLTV